MAEWFVYQQEQPRSNWRCWDLKDSGQLMEKGRLFEMSKLKMLEVEEAPKSLYREQRKARDASLPHFLPFLHPTSFPFFVPLPSLPSSLPLLPFMTPFFSSASCPDNHLGLHLCLTADHVYFNNYMYKLIFIIRILKSLTIFFLLSCKETKAWNNYLSVSQLVCKW